MDEFFDELWENITRGTPKLLLAAAILVGGWIVARVLSRLVFKVLVRTRIDDWAVRRLGIDTQGKYGHRVERFVGRVVFYALLIVALVLALDTLQVQTISQPFRNLVTGFGDAVPKVLLATIIVTLAYFIGKILSFSVVKALEATRLDKRFRRIEEGAEGVSLPKGIGSLVFWSVLFIGIVQGLDALEMDSLVEPLQGALNEFVAILPDLIGATLVVGIGVIIARFVGTLCGDILADIGFNQFFYRIMPITAPDYEEEIDDEAPETPEAGVEGDSEAPDDDSADDDAATEADDDAATEADDDAATEADDTGEEPSPPALRRTPARVGGQVITILIALLVVLQALSILHLDRLALLLESFILNFLPNLAIGAVIVVAGIWAGNWVKAQIDGLTDEREGGLLRFLGSLARIGILVFTIAMALQQIGVAPELIRTAFAILFGALSLALALSFGLGGRDVASDIVGKEYSRHTTATGKKQPSKSKAGK